MQMNKPIRIIVLAGLAVALFAGNAFAGRGGGGGHVGGGMSRGGGFSGGGMSRPAMGHTPSFNAPRPSTGAVSGLSSPQRFDMSRSTNWSSYSARQGTGAGAGVRPDVRPGTRPEIRPGTRPDTHPWSGARPGTLPARTDWARHDWYHGNHDWYHGNWHGHWDHPWYGWPAGWFGAGFAVGVASATPWSWGYWPYYNPYYVAPIVTGGTVIDYSQPIVAAGEYAAPPEQVADQPAPAAQSEQLLDAARDAFAQGDYRTALSRVDQAIAKQPNDPVVHQFRSLVCFALKRYDEAAAAAYAVLSVGPGWDWTTLCSFYPDVAVYTEQLRALEQYIVAHPNAADARFLVAYQYLTCGYTDAAIRQLKAAVELNPKDQLSAQLLASLSKPEGAAPPAPSVPSKPGKPVSAASLVGNWNAQQPDGSAVALRLTADSKYTWQFTRQGKTQKHSGNYTVADNLLILKQGDAPVMVGQLASLGDDSFNFKLANDNPSDPGLTFNK
jgi:hypothetical protein